MEIPTQIGTTTITELTNLALEPLFMLINLWNDGIGKAILTIVLLMFVVSIAVDFFKFAQEKIKEAFRGW